MKFLALPRGRASRARTRTRTPAKRCNPTRIADPLGKERSETNAKHATYNDETKFIAWDTIMFFGRWIFEIMLDLARPPARVKNILIRGWG